MSEIPRAERPLLTEPYLHDLEQLGNRLIIDAELEAAYRPNNPAVFTFRSGDASKQAAWHLATGTAGTYEELAVVQRPDSINLKLTECHVGARPAEQWRILSRVGHLAVAGSTLSYYHQVGKADLLITTHPVLLKPGDFQSDNALRYFTDDIWSLIGRLELSLPDTAGEIANG